MDYFGLTWPQGNDVVVTARWPDIVDGTGLTSKLYYKPHRSTPDTDPAVNIYSASIVPDPGGTTMSQFNVPAADNGIPGIFWWRVDAVDINSKVRTAAGGPLWVEGVLW